MHTTIDNRDDLPGVIAPPPFIFLGFLLLGTALQAVLPLVAIPEAARSLCR